MAELAFESIIRLAIALIVLAMIIGVINTLFSKISFEQFEQNKTKEGVEIIHGNIGEEGLSGLMQSCYNQWHQLTPEKEVEECYVVVGADVNDVKRAAGKLNFTEVEREISGTIVIGYRVSDDTVIIR
ncbi:MAG: hypothetical protein QXY05_00560 [Candidatus Anstonellales archaeon]